MCSVFVTLSVYPTPGKLKNQPDRGQADFSACLVWDIRGQADFSACLVWDIHSE